MKIVVACDSFKGCLSSKDVNEKIKDGILKDNIKHEVLTYSIGDGGEGTVDAFYDTIGGERISIDTVDGYFQKVKAVYLLKDELAIMEVSSCLGLSMYPREKRFPMYASSYGVGILIKDAILRGCKKIIIGLGGSCTNDGGLGLLQALGVKFYDNESNLLNGKAISLEKVFTIDNSQIIDTSNIEITVACDVKNHLLGEHGATMVFGKQKGLFPNQMKRMEAAMQNYANRSYKCLKIDLNKYEGGGSAGGIGAALQGYLNATMRNGVDLLCSYSTLEEQIQTCDLVISGEGQSDRQTKYGKVPVAILNIANKYDKPTIIISGALGLDYSTLYELGFAGIYSISDRAMSFQQALDNASPKLEACAYAIIHTIERFNK